MKNSIKLPTVKTDIQIRFTDIDKLGHVTNSVYTQYFDIGRIHFFDELRKISDVPMMVVASIKIDMLKEIRLKDVVYVETKCTRVGNKSMTFDSNIISNGLVAAKGTVVTVGFDLETRQSIKLPDFWIASV